MPGPAGPRRRCGRSTASTGPTSRTAPFVPATHPRVRRADGDADTEHLLDAARRRRPVAPPLRLVLDERAALPRAGRRRPECARHQADALPHQRRLPDRQRADRRGRRGQAGARARRDQGPLRRAGQHQVGPRRWRRPAATSSTGWSASRRTARPVWWCAGEGSTIRRYCHIGTGNYNPKTARLYEDVGLLTADPEVGADLDRPVQLAVRLLAQGELPQPARRPARLRTGIVERIEREIDRAPRVRQRPDSR